jgi:hypothetical protein
MMKDIFEFYEAQPEPNKNCFLTLRDIILGYSEEISETVKYGMPCFLYGKEILCYLWKDKQDKPYILVAKGREIHHPRLEQGTRKKMKILSVDPKGEIEVDVIEEILSLSIDFILN